MVWWEKALVGSKGKLWECGLVGKSAGWVKGKATGVWSGKGKPPPGSKRKPPKCGLARENCRLGQRESHRSVAWQGKTAAWVKEEALGVWPGKGKPPPGSKGKPSECGLTRKTAAWVKGKATGVWPGKGKLPPGSKKKSPECGLTRKNAAWVKRKAAGVWSGGKKRWLGQRKSHRSVV